MVDPMEPFHGIIEQLTPQEYLGLKAACAKVAECSQPEEYQDPLKVLGITTGEELRAREDAMYSGDLFHEPNLVDEVSQ